MTYYIKDIYILEKNAEENANDSISIDESLFPQENNLIFLDILLINTTIQT